MSWRSLCSCTIESFGRFGVSGSQESAREDCARAALERPVYSDQVPQANICKRVK